MAVHTRTAATRLLLVHGPRVEFRYRYESWVQMASRRPALRVDLTALAGEMTREDGADGRWRFEGVEHITPRMYREGGASVLTPEDIRRRLEAALRVGAPGGIRTSEERHPWGCDRSAPWWSTRMAVSAAARADPAPTRTGRSAATSLRSVPAGAPRGLSTASGRAAARARSSRSSACGSSPSARPAARW